MSVAAKPGRATTVIAASETTPSGAKPPGIGKGRRRYSVAAAQRPTFWFMIV